MLKEVQKLYQWRVRTPEHGAITVEAPSREMATMLAAKLWRGRWVHLVSQMDVERLGTAEKRICKECGLEMARTVRGTICPACVRAQQARRSLGAAYAKSRQREEAERAKEETRAARARTGAGGGCGGSGGGQTSRHSGFQGTRTPVGGYAAAGTRV